MAEKFLHSENNDSGNESTVISSLTSSDRERIKHLLIGSRRAVKGTITALHVKGYAEAGEWSKPQPAGVLGESGEVICILIRHLLLE